MKKQTQLKSMVKAKVVQEDIIDNPFIQVEDVGAGDEF